MLEQKLTELQAGAKARIALAQTPEEIEAIRVEALGRKAIALNDRLLLTRELFGGDNQAFDNAIHALNGFQGMEQAKAYLLDQCVMRYRWMDKKHLETAKNFIKLVRRRYN